MPICYNSTMRIYSTAKRKPTEKDANGFGVVFARKRGRLAFEGVPWKHVSPDKYSAWGHVNQRGEP